MELKEKEMALKELREEAVSGNELQVMPGRCVLEGHYNAFERPLLMIDVGRLYSAQFLRGEISGKNFGRRRIRKFSGAIVGLECNGDTCYRWNIRCSLEEPFNQNEMENQERGSSVQPGRKHKTKQQRILGNTLRSAPLDLNHVCSSI